MQAAEEFASSWYSSFSLTFSLWCFFSTKWVTFHYGCSRRHPSLFLLRIRNRSYPLHSDFLAQFQLHPHSRDHFYHSFSELLTVFDSGVLQARSRYCYWHLPTLLLLRQFRPSFDHLWCFSLFELSCISTCSYLRPEEWPLHSLPDTPSCSLGALVGQALIASGTLISLQLAFSWTYIPRWDFLGLVRDHYHLVSSSHPISYNVTKDR